MRSISNLVFIIPHYQIYCNNKIKRAHTRPSKLFIEIRLFSVTGKIIIALSFVYIFVRYHKHRYYLRVCPSMIRLYAFIVKGKNFLIDKTKFFKFWAKLAEFFFGNTHFLCKYLCGASFSFRFFRKGKYHDLKCLLIGKEGEKFGKIRF